AVVAAVEAAAPVQEQAKAEEIAPEDLPPLEYAELQKATGSRRRRRHRSSANANNNASSPTAPGHPAPAAPVRPATSQTTQQYSIVSGYTVSQMNQGNEISGPFMPPEPSPARGSIITREVRAPRAEVVRAPAPAYPMRPGPQEHGLSAATLNQFANVIGQAIQTQTDRMVTELRRVTQAPTNVSVSLPPFPSNERVGVFVDVANLLYSARTLRIAVDFGKLLDFLRGNRRLVRAQAYCPTSPQPSDEQMFLQAVKGLGYRITTKHYKTFSSGAKKADLDLDLCMDVVRLVDGKAVDCIVLVSGDSDFMPMLDYCSDHGVRVEVAAFDEAMSATLRQSCDLFVNLSMLEEIRA
ncbi:MAG: NYN domain-containing protein, partial [Ktedonobacteraceae bacterium]|nr:NYN domain-containing protein [Ktedonobacteraceae bacterium]